MEYTQTLTETLKNEILRRYKNIKQFSDASGIPYMTISSVLKRGVENSVFGTVLRICDALNISVDILIRDRALDTIKQKIMLLGDNYTHEQLKSDLIDGKTFPNLDDADFTDELTKKYRKILTGVKED